jgi:hypothetical protein
MASIDDDGDVRFGRWSRSGSEQSHSFKPFLRTRSRMQVIVVDSLAWIDAFDAVSTRSVERLEGLLGVTPWRWLIRSWWRRQVVVAGLF